MSAKNMVFHGNTYEQTGNTAKKLLNVDAVSGANNIEVVKALDGKSVTVQSTLPISIVDGALCVTFEREIEEV